jgi:hypothetical protein
LQEILLQSHGGIIRVVPALSNLWSGVFQLRAEGGFLVGADVTDGVPKIVEVRSLWGKRCRIENPWNGPSNVLKGRNVVLSSDGKVLEFDTIKDGFYVIESAVKPAASYGMKPLEERYSEARGYAAQGLPGRHD